MRAPIITFAILLTLLAPSLSAQISDVSDSLWSIVVPTAAAIDIDMGQVLVNDSRDSVVTAFLTNTGPVDITIEDIRFSGADAGMFSLVSGIPPFDIAMGVTREVEFRFSPSSVGVKTATIFVHTQIDTLAQSIRGEGVLPQIEVLADLVDFGAVLVGGIKDTVVTAVIRNSGGGTVAISGTGQLGPDMTQFSVISGGGAFMLGAGESHTMQLRFAPTAPGRTSGRLGLYHDGVGSPAEVHLFGEGIGLAGVATLGLDTIRAAAGELVEIPVYLRGQQNLALTGATGFFADLRFNATLLSPTGATPQGRILNGERSISLDNIPVQPDARGILARYSFIAMLGDAEGTPLHLENAFAVGGNVAVAEIPGYFLLTDICREGGTRLFHQSGAAGLRQNRPNPFNATTVIEYEVVENGPTRLHVMDLLGRTAAVLVEGTVEAGRYTVAFDASALSSGTYLYVLQTPTQRFHKLMEVAK